MIFSVYMYKCYKYNITHLPKKAKIIFSRKNSLRRDISGINEKMIFILENMVFLLKYHID